MLLGHIAPPSPPPRTRPRKGISSACCSAGMTNAVTTRSLPPLPLVGPLGIVLVHDVPAPPAHVLMHGAAAVQRGGVDFIAP